MREILTRLKDEITFYSLALSPLSALTISARKECGRRYNWTCQGTNDEPCVWESVNGKPASFKDGFWVTAAHFPDKHHLTGKGYHDPDPDNARPLCSCCHGLEELDRGNLYGARKNFEDGVFSRNHLSEYPETEQIYLTPEEAREFQKMAREKRLQMAAD